MNKKHFLVSIFQVLFLLLTYTINAQADKRPNILIIMADDLGYGDLSITGGKTPTPNIDRILKEGVRFSNFMTNPVCSPTRGGLLTGQHPLKIGAGPETGGNLDLKLANFGNYFQKEGYKTGLFGKWHNSPSPNEVPNSNTVNQYGFNRFVGFYAGAVDYYSKGSTGWFHDGKLVEDEMDYATDLTAKYAIEFMDKTNKEKKPFLCYVPFQAVHGPHVVKEELLKRVPAEILSKVKDMKSYDYYRKAVVNIPKWREYNAEKYQDDTWNAKEGKLEPEEVAMLYSAVITSFDDNVGLIMEHLKKNNLVDDTIILFLSDNGGTPTAGNNTPFRGSKHSLYEGGIHSPTAMMIPKAVLPNTQKVVSEMCGFLDVFPTMIALTKSKQKLPPNLDGISLVNLIKGTSKPQTDRYYYWNWRDHDVLRSDQWKLFRYYNKLELYDIVNDIAETKDVASSNPEVVKKMLVQIEIESKKTGVAKMHVPLDIKVSKPNPRGNQIAINISSEGELKKETIKILRTEFTILANYYLDYDVKIDSKSDLSFCYFSPLRAKNAIFNDKTGVDLNGKPIQSPTKYDDDWHHVSLGLGSFSPLRFGELGVTFKFRKPGKTTVYFDNICIKNLKGEVVYKFFEEDLKKGEITLSNAKIIKQ